MSETPTDAQLLAKYGGAAPRYTSYPTAVQFATAYGADAHAEALSRLDPAKAVSLYAHIPFCERLCWYCGCNTRAVRRREAVSKYIELLAQEVERVGACLPGRLAAHAIHLGGGTPNMTSADDLESLFRAFANAFDVAADAAVSAELDPRVLTQDWVLAATSHGLNRASLGVQDLSPEVQAAVNRIEGFDVLERAVGWLRQAGVASINFDLMYGLPKQTTSGVLQTLDKVLTLRPNRIALFGYAHVPWMKAHQNLIDQADLPGPEERLDQSTAAAQRFVAEGYVPIGLDHFALPDDSLAVAAREGRLRRNFQGYTDDTAEALIGFGASAISQLPGGIAQNVSDEMGWRKAVSERRIPTARGVALTAEDRLRGAVIEQLMCAHRADIAALRARLNDPATDLSSAFDQLRLLAADGLVDIVGETVAVTERGRPYLRAACLAFDAYFEPTVQRHSIAV